MKVAIQNVRYSSVEVGWHTNPQTIQIFTAPDRNVSFPGVDSEALMVALKDCIAVSNGSACTSQSYQPSHVLKAMGLPESVIKGAVRISWCHMTEAPDWNEVVDIINKLR